MPCPTDVKFDSYAVRSVMRKSQVIIEESNFARLELFSLYCTTVILVNTNVENLPHFRAVLWDST
jgi:hypothetical protein